MSLLSGRAGARRALIDGYALAVSAAGLDMRRLRRVGARGGVLILNLHNVSPREDPLIRAMPPETFDELVGWLKKRCELTTLGGLSSARKDPDRPIVVLSFDDGYRDFVEYAMPVLERHETVANQNVIPSCVDSGRPPWNVELLARLGRLPLSRLDELTLPSGRLPTLESTGRDRIRWGVAVSRLLKMRSREEREPLVEALLDQIGGDDGSGPAMMTLRDVQDAAAVHEIGLHSMEHDSMEFESDECFESDLHSCRRWYEAHLDESPRVYAFPNGSGRPSQIDAARNSGLDHVLLVGERPSEVDAHVHSRVTADGVTLRELRMRVARAC